MLKDRYILLFFLMIFSGSNLFNILGQTNPGCRQIASAHSGIACFGDLFSGFNNPASLASNKERQLGFFYSPAPYGLKELSNAFAAYSEPLHFGNIAFALKTYGFELYRENAFNATLSLPLNEFIYSGISLQINSVSIRNYGSDLSPSINAGLILTPLPDLDFAIVFKNISKSTYGNYKDQIPFSYSAGAAYEYYPNSFLCFSLEKEMYLPLSFRTGLNYKIIECIELLSGIMSYPDSYSAGINIMYSIFQVQYSFYTITELGLTHQLGIIILLNDI